MLAHLAKTAEDCALSRKSYECSQALRLEAKKLRCFFGREGVLIYPACLFSKNIYQVEFKFCCSHYRCLECCLVLKIWPKSYMFTRNILIFFQGLEMFFIVYFCSKLRCNMKKKDFFFLILGFCVKIFFKNSFVLALRKSFLRLLSSNVIKNELFGQYWNFLVLKNFS